MFISISYVCMCFCTIPSNGHTSLSTALALYAVYNIEPSFVSFPKRVANIIVFHSNSLIN